MTRPSTPAAPAGWRIQRVRTSGLFSLDGQDFEVENNIWLAGDEEEVLVIDAAHDAAAIVAAVAGRRVPLIVATHGHNDHINAAADLAAATGAPVALHPADRMLWDGVHPDLAPDVELADGQRLAVAGASLEVRHTPGHSPGGVCLYLAEGGVVFSGDTLFQGGPGATGRSWSDYPTIVESIRNRLLTLPGATIVHTGHGDDTSIGAEAPSLPDWLAALNESRSDVKQ
ncbi:MAG TPA: MBL fold metallo-hydrolase [Acidimicrobiales bacterium]|nr:MBL fold metallo-hydrolase [Acidimicrobiales bacterium]